ncbi:MAG: alpha/beta hydrolase fold domain-containing protein, partial [Acidimicrobiales bacterium]
LGCGHPLANLSITKAVEVLGGHASRLGGCVASAPPWPGPLVAALLSAALAGVALAAWLRAGSAQAGFARASQVRTRLGPKALVARAATLRPQTPPGSASPANLGIYLGHARPGGPVWASVEDSILVLGPPRSGKTTSLLVPALASFPGPVLATSTRADLVGLARRYRAELATFDPQGVAPTVATLRWSPVWGAEVPMVAVLRARALALGAGFSGSGTSNSDFWLSDHAADLGVNRSRIGHMGDSGGGGPTAGAAILARDRNVPLAKQILVYPMLDHRNTTPGSVPTELLTWGYDNNYTGWATLLGDGLGADDVSPIAAPARLLDFAGLAPAYIEVGDLDIFRDESIAYALGLSRAGVPIELHVHPGAPHGFERFVPDADVARRAMADRARAVTTI